MRYLTDFNNIYDDNRIWTVARRDTYDGYAYGEAAHEPSRGDVVELFDYDGASCLAVIAECHPNTFDCIIDWSTWQTVSQEIPPPETNIVATYHDSAKIIAKISA